jgi:hypothetical protein
MRRFVGVVLAVALWFSASGVADAVTLWPAVATTTGLPYFATQQSDAALPAAVDFASTTTETIDSVTLPIGMTGDEARLQLEIYEQGDTVPGAVSTQIYRPNADLSNQDNTWVNQALATTNLYQSIDEATANDSNWVGYLGPQNPGKQYTFNVGSAAWAAGQRVVGGFVRIRANRQDTTGRLRVSYYDGSDAYSLGTITVPESKQNLNVPWPETNPATGFPWTRAQIQALDSTAGIRLTPVNVNKQKPLRVYQAYLSLDYVTEERVAVAVTDLDPRAPAVSAGFVLRNPNTGADNWSKAAAQSYTILLRRTGGFGQGAWRFLTETADMSEALLRPDQNVALPVESYQPLLDAQGMVSVVGDQIPGRAQTFYMQRTDAAYSVDGQPYDRVEVAVLNSALIGYGQTFTPATSGDYPLLRFTASTTDEELPSSPITDLSTLPDLEIRVKNATTDVQVGSTYTLAGEDLADFPTVGMITDSYSRTAYAVAVELTGITLVASTQYYIEFGPVTPTDSFWTIVQATGDSFGSVSTYGGAVDTRVTTDGSTITSAETDLDLTATLSIAPTAPTNLAATTDTIPNDPDLDGVACTIENIDVIDLTWDATALGADFGRYDVERSDDAAGYLPIYEGTEEAAEACTDYESLRGEEATYRMRVVRGGDWVPSAYSTTDTATANPEGSEVVFAANWLGDALAVNRGPEVEWPQPNNDRVLQLAGRDYQLLFQEVENRGDGGADGWDIPVTVFYGQPDNPQPTPDGRAAFAPLIDFLRTYTPYLSVLFADGGRWYGRATLSPASISNSPDAAGNYSATIAVVVTQAVPSPVPSIPSTGS